MDGRILIVEDDEEIAALVELYLTVNVNEKVSQRLMKF